jgi:flagellar motility protein MotE (MotC chaperone)
MPPSKLCRLLIFTFALKFVVVGLILFDPGSSFSAFHGAGALSVASAAVTGGPAASPPAVEATLPDTGIYGATPGVKSHVDSPAAAPGIIPPVPQTPDAVRPLPPIASSGASSDAAPTALQPDLKNAAAKRQEDLARKEQELRVLEGELNSRLERMQILENRLSSMIKEAEGTQDAKFRHLVDMLSNMKAKQAAAVLETLDQKVSVKVLAVMRGRQAGEILTYVKPQIAAQLTEALARMQLPLQRQ